MRKREKLVEKVIEGRHGKIRENRESQKRRRARIPTHTGHRLIVHCDIL